MASQLTTNNIIQATISPNDNQTTKSTSSANSNVIRRGRSSSLVTVEHVGESPYEVLDQSAYVNPNAEWVNRKGAWVMHPILILAGKICLDTFPGMSQQASWTFVNLGYIAISYMMFHWATGIPFHPEMHAGAYDELTFWEQIDGGEQYTPAKKFLICTPIVLFLLSTHYTHYNPWVFAINFTALIFCLFPKLPILHGKRVRVLPPGDMSGFATPAPTSNAPTRANSFYKS
ncbi:putative ORM1-unfolded protein response protein [Serendipita vermifera]|nr:putative ORM1-unfolded protein response protein [Serendipita vermifera]